MRKIKIKNADGIFVELTVSKEIYNIYVTDKHNEIEREKYRDKKLRKLTDSTILENHLDHAIENLDEILQDKELMERINKVLEKCTSTQKRRFEMWFFERLTMRDIAAIEKIYVNAIQDSIKQVRKKFKKYF